MFSINMLWERFLGLLQTRDFWSRLVVFVLFILGQLKFDLADKVDPEQITTLIVAIVSALVVFDPWKLVMVILEFLGILQSQE